VAAFRGLSRQPDGPWIVQLADGRRADAVNLLFDYQQAAKAELQGRDAETDLLLSVWSQTLDALASDPETLAGKVDWITKRWLFRQFREQEKIPWSHPWLKSQDLEFHHIDPARGLGAALAQNPPGWELPRKEVTQAAFLAPANTRAAVRSRAMRLLKDEKRGYYIDWESVGADGGNALQMLNPFDAAPADSAARNPRRGQPQP
jgi:proteasome accessory factor A